MCRSRRATTPSRPRRRRRPSFEPNEIAGAAGPAAQLRLPTCRPAVAPGPGSRACGAPSPASSRNTFIEAARRAAQRQTPPKAEVQSNSLIGRALARFQTGSRRRRAEGSRQAEGAARAARRQAGAHRRSSPSRRARGRRVAAPPRIDAPSLEPQVAVDGPAPRPEAKESFLTRHRRVILLAAAVVAIGFLTVNLVAQRLAPAAPICPRRRHARRRRRLRRRPATSRRSSGAPTADAPAPSMPPRVIPMVDCCQTGSIDHFRGARLQPRRRRQCRARSRPRPTPPMPAPTADAASLGEPLARRGRAR